MGELRESPKRKEGKELPSFKSPLMKQGILARAADCEDQKHMVASDLSSYTLLDIISEGEACQVVKAIHKSSNQIVAIKCTDKSALSALPVTTQNAFKM